MSPFPFDSPNSIVVVSSIELYFTTLESGPRKRSTDVSLALRRCSVTYPGVVISDNWRVEISNDLSRPFQFSSFLSPHHRSSLRYYWHPPVLISAYSCRILDHWYWFHVCIPGKRWSSPKPRFEIHDNVTQMTSRRQIQMDGSQFDFFATPNVWWWSQYPEIKLGVQL